jgi:ABC-type dipeptide/oligopeptide/nickel transport system ATPase component
MDSALEVKGLAVEFEGGVRAVRGVSLTVPVGKTLAIVGESGSGKTTLALALLGLLPSSAKITGSAILHGVDLLSLDPRGEEMRRVRGKKIGMIFQEPAVALSPVYTVGEQIAESLRLHRGMNRAEAWSAAIAALARVGIADPERRVSEYPHELSGGMRQRVMIAIALAGEPAILLADEPTASLDVTVQAAVLSLMRTLQAERKTSLVLITHDLGVVAEMADDVVVMKEGLIVESAPVDAIFHAPGHEYTRELLAAAVLR